MAYERVENLFRQNVELIQAIGAFFLTGYLGFIVLQGILMPLLALVGMCAAFSYGILKFRASRRLGAYQKSFTRMPTYKMSLSDVPIRPKRLFIGKGFKWRTRHVNRYFQSKEPENEGFVQIPGWFESIREWVSFREDAKGAHDWIVRLANHDRWYNPIRPIPDLQGSLSIHAVGLFEREKSFYLPYNALAQQLFIEGTTGVGKTRLLEILAYQLIIMDEICIYFDPKGDTDMIRTMYKACKDSGRLDDFYVFHLEYPELSSRYNPVGSFTRITEPATRIANNMPSKGQAASFKEFVWRFVAIISMALIDLGDRPDYTRIHRYYRDIDALFKRYCEHYLKSSNYKNGAWRDVLENFKDKHEIMASEGKVYDPKDRGRKSDAVAYRNLMEQYLAQDELMNIFKSDDKLAIFEGLLSIINHEKSHFDKLVAGLEPLLLKLTSGEAAKLLSPDYLDLDDDRPIFDWRQIIRQKGVVYIGLGALTDTTVASAVGQAMFSDLTSMAGEFYAHSKDFGLPGAAPNTEHSLVFNLMDEFSDLVGPEIIPMLSKGRGSGMRNIVSSQSMSDIIAGLEDEAMAHQVLGNLSNRVVYRVIDPKTTKEFVDGFDEAYYQRITEMNSETGSTNPHSDADFTSTRITRPENQKVKFISEDMLKNLPIGQCYVRHSGSHIEKIRIPQPMHDDDDEMPDNIKLLLKNMQDNYRPIDRDWRVDLTYTNDVLGALSSTVPENEPKDNLAIGALVETGDKDELLIASTDFGTDREF